MDEYLHSLDVADAVARATRRRPLTEEEEALHARGSQMLAAVIKTGLLPYNGKKVKHVDDKYLCEKDKADIARERAGRRNREAA